MGALPGAPVSRPEQPGRPSSSRGLASLSKPITRYSLSPKTGSGWMCATGTRCYRGRCAYERHGSIVYGLVNFGNQVGRSEFTIVLGGQPEFSFEVEVFPTKLDYVSDYEHPPGRNPRHPNGVGP